MKEGFTQAVLRGFALALVLCMARMGLLAASITEDGDAAMGCNILVSGPIVSGDADRLAALFETQGIIRETMSPVGTRICFDSPGGSMVEAMKMASLILDSARGTAVAAGAVCESACALAFMAGSHFNLEGEGLELARILHPTATLGFHAPSLEIEAGAYNAAEVGRAFGLALETLALVAERRSGSGYDFPESLFLTLLRTPPSDMFYVETVGQAAQLRIGIAPAEFWDGDVREAVINACMAADAGLLDASWPFQNSNLRPNINAITINAASQSFPSALIPFGLRAEAASGCQVSLFGGGGPLNHPTTSAGVALIGAIDLGIIEGRTAIYPAYTFPSDTRLRDLPPDPGDARSRFIARLVDSAR